MCRFDGPLACVILFDKYVYSVMNVYYIYMYHEHAANKHYMAAIKLPT